MRIRACIRHFKCVAEVKQNLDSRVQPVTSYAWSCILRKMALDFEAALKTYNSHPEVVATGDAVCIDRKKQLAITNWMENTSPAAADVVWRSTQDAPFNLGAFGETFAATGQMFMGSVAGPGPTQGGTRPLPGEATVTVDWTLPLTGWAQELLLCSLIHGHTHKMQDTFKDDCMHE